LLINRAAQ